ncbi:MAG: DNA repair protein RecN [Bacteroidales bacterium]|nr:DNA repair protein RecN [Bacteroidales bacterium]
MIKQLVIKNYTLIDKLEIQFFEGFSVMTGETGAGKSIIIGALSLILGKRADLQSLKNKSEKCVVEGFFVTEKSKLESFFVENDLDFDAENTILRREILPSGKSRAFINDTPVSLVQLRELADKVVDIHSQNSTTLLQSASFQLNVLDNFSGNTEILGSYRKLFEEYTRLRVKLGKLVAAEKVSEIEQDFYKFQYDELDKAALKTGEQDEIEEELKILNNAGEIKTRLAATLNLIEGEYGLSSVFKNILAEIKPLKNISRELSQIYARIESNSLEFDDIANDLIKIEDSVEVNPERENELNERINLIYHLQQKHRVSEIDGLTKVKEEYLLKIEQHQSLENEIASTGSKLKNIKSEIEALANELSVRRQNAISELEARLKEKVFWLGMPDAEVKLNLHHSTELNDSGADKVTFLFNANKGGELQEMAKVASGGELSRLMLAVKSQIAAKNLISSIIFDEIDSGISGEIAGKMASIMQTLASEIQVISITHLPQIAARGMHHYLVAKESHENSTSTSVKLLTEEERVVEIAKMLSDSNVSNSALQTARVLMKN